MYTFFQKCKIHKKQIQKHKTILENVLLLLILAAGFLWMYQEHRLQQTQHDIAEKILRFHVRANSDSREDQALKLKVRDAVGSFMQQELADAANLSESIQAVETHLPDILDTAQQAILQEGYHYPVTAKIETVDFPKKAYGDYTFPAGEYQALDIVIGSGKGQNWWCVMYPNMCFHGAVYEVVDKDAKHSLQQVLSEDEYDAVLKSRKFQIRFKYLDFLNPLFE